jgi:hypothetical protein
LTLIGNPESVFDGGVTLLTAPGKRMRDMWPRQTAPTFGAGQTEPTMVKLLALLIAITMSCGVAAAVTISLAPPSTERVVAGY